MFKLWTNLKYIHKQLLDLFLSHLNHFAQRSSILSLNSSYMTRPQHSCQQKKSMKMNKNFQFHTWKSLPHFFEIHKDYDFVPSQTKQYPHTPSQRLFDWKGHNTFCVHFPWENWTIFGDTWTRDYIDNNFRNLPPLKLLWVVGAYDLAISAIS